MNFNSPLKVKTTNLMKVLLIISLLFLIVSCKKNTATKTEKKQVTVNVKGKPVKAEASLTNYQDGHSEFTLIGGGKNLLFLQISPTGLIQDFGGEPPFLRCMREKQRICRQSRLCTILSVGGANMSFVMGWAIGCAAGM